MVWAPANTFLFINPSPIGRISETGDDSIRVIYLKQLRKTSAAVWFCLTLIPLKSIPRTEYIVLPYNTRASTLWTPFRGWILSCQKGVAFHDHPETWLKEAVSIWNPLEDLSRLSLLRSWQTADLHYTLHIKNNRIIHFSVSSPQFEGDWFVDKLFYFHQLVTVWH